MYFLLKRLVYYFIPTKGVYTNCRQLSNCYCLFNFFFIGTKSKLAKTGLVLYIYLNVNNKSTSSLPNHHFILMRSLCSFVYTFLCLFFFPGICWWVFIRGNIIIVLCSSCHQHLTVFQIKASFYYSSTLNSQVYNGAPHLSCSCQQFPTTPRLPITNPSITLLATTLFCSYN